MIGFAQIPLIAVLPIWQYREVSLSATPLLPYTNLSNSLGVQSGLWGIIAKARLMIIQLISFVPYHVAIVINNK